jgi:predicted phosphodiesterase
MKLQLLSDLHLEGQPHWMPRYAPGADALVLAGDIGSYQAGSRLQDADFGLARFSPLQGWPVPVYFIPGNHEYDGMDFPVAHARLRASCARLGIAWLDGEVLHLPWTDVHGRPVRMLGSTLWSDFDALGPHAGLPDAACDPRHLGAHLKAREKAFRAADFYLKKTGTTLGGAPLLAEAVRALGLQSQAWLRQALATPFAGSTVVVPHFAPSLHSADTRYGRVPGTAGFCNALDDLLDYAQLWLHGHLHTPHDYVHRVCRVVANPLGYAHKNEQTHFQAQTLIEI